jgi:hypothetical protein
MRAGGTAEVTPAKISRRIWRAQNLATASAFGLRPVEIAQTRKPTSPPLPLVPGCGRRVKARDCQPQNPWTAILRPTAAGSARADVGGALALPRLVTWVGALLRAEQAAQRLGSVLSRAEASVDPNSWAFWYHVRARSTLAI